MQRDAMSLNHDFIAKLTLVFIGFIAAAYGLSSFPSYQLSIAVIALLFSGLYLYRPYLLFTVLPAMLILFDLSTSTGRFVVNELDFVLLPTVFMAIASFTKFRSIKLSALVVLLGLIALILSHVSVSWLSTFWSQPLQANPYYLDGYAFRVAKGFCYGLLLASILAEQLITNKKATIKALIIGAIIGSYCLFLTVLWERGVLWDLFQFNNWWQPLSSFLDFTSSYRVTALVSAMHTGGEAYDGYILFLLPLTLLGCFYFQSPSLRFLSLIGVACVSYCTLVGFTRTTYLAAGVAIVTLSALIIFNQKSQQRVDKGLIITSLVVILSASILFSLKGYVGLFSTLLLFAVHSLVVPALAQRLPMVVVNAGQFLVAIALAAYLFVSQSKWLENSVISDVIAIGILICLAAFLVVNTLRQPASNIISGLFRVCIIAGLAFVINVIGNSYQFNSRLDTAVADLGTRFVHWDAVLQSSEQNMKTTLVGNGVGSFPLNYLLAHPSTVRNVGNFSVKNSQLILDSGRDLAFGQRVSIKPHTNYTLEVGFAETKAANLTAFLCERNLIFASNFSANCITKRIRFDGSSASSTVTLNSGRIGGKGLLGWPATLYLKAIDGVNTIKINELLFYQQNNSSNENILSNSDFSQGLDHWFFYNDFEHLPWHIKNIYLSIYYQLGLVGMLLIMLLLYKNVSVKFADDELNLFKYTSLAYIAGILVFGLFGDPLDSPRASIMFSILVFTLYILSALDGKRKMIGT